MIRNPCYWYGYLLLAASVGFVGCGDDGPSQRPDAMAAPDAMEAPKPDVTIGLLTPLNANFPAAISDGFERAATTAIEEINASGGVDGHNLQLIVVDSWPIGPMGPDSALIEAAIQDASDQGAVGAVGPAISLSVQLGFPKAKELAFPLISPSSTAPELAGIDDGGFVFRNAGHDDAQALAVALRLTQRGITQVHVMAQDDVYGQGFATVFTAVFEGAAAGNQVMGTVFFTSGLTEQDADTHVATLAAQNPGFVVLVSLQDSRVLTQRWAAIPDGQRPDATWFFTDGARTADFLASAPDLFLNAEGTARLGHVPGDALDALDNAWSERYPDDFRDLTFTANVWDGVFLLATGLVLQSVNPEEFGGEGDDGFGGDGLRRAISEISRPPGATFHAGQWRDLVGALRSGGAVDLEGASGTIDFDRCGEVVGSYEVWKLAENANERVFEQEAVFTSDDLNALGSLDSVCPVFD